MGATMSSEWPKPNHPPCPCGGETRYFGEALMGSLTCNKCGDYLSVVGWDMLSELNAMWIRGERGHKE